MNKGCHLRGGSRSPSWGATRHAPHRTPSQPPSRRVGNSSCSNPATSVFHKYHGWEVETLRAELEAERQRSHEARRNSDLQARELHKAAEWDRQMLADQLHSRWEMQRAHELQLLTEAIRKHREAEIRRLLRWKEAELRASQKLLQEELDAAMRQARDLQRQLAKELVSHSASFGRGPPGGGLSTECLAKLQEALGTLRCEVDGDQASRIRHLKAELELERSLFLKYILERFEGEPFLPASSWPGSRQASMPQAPSKARALSLESLIAACTPDVKAVSKICSLNSTRGCESPCRPPSEEGRSPANSTCPEQPRKAALGTDVEQEASAQEASADLPPEGKTSHCGVAGEGAEEVQQQQGWMSGQGYNQLMKQNADLFGALSDLEQRYHHLKEENALLRRSRFPKMQEKVRMLKKKSAELAAIAKRLDERAQKLQESHLRARNARMPMPLNCSDMEFCETTFAEQQAKDLNEQARILLAKEQQLEVIQEERLEEPQAKASAGQRSTFLLSVGGFNRLLRESRKEVLRLQRQVALRSSLKESLQTSPTIASDRSSSSVIMLEASPTERASLQDSSLAKNTPEIRNFWGKDAESEGLLWGKEAKKYKNGTLETDSKSDPYLELVEKQLVGKLRECENLRHEVEEKQKRCDEAELRLSQVLRENVMISEENSQLHRKIKWAEKVENENAQMKVKLIGAGSERDSAVQLARGLGVKAENLEQVIKDMKEGADIRRQLESQYGKTLPELQKKVERRQLQHLQTDRKREYEETGQLLEAQLKEIENLHHNQTKHCNLLSQGLEALQVKLAGLLGSELSPTTCNSTGRRCPVKREPDPYGALHGSNGITEGDSASAPSAALIKEATELDSSGPESTQNRSTSSLNPQADVTGGEMGDPDTGNMSIDRPPENKGCSKLRAFLARYSYDPSDGPNKDPERELPLTAGEYVYIFGEMDEDGFYEGELMDGRRGLVPSNLVEEASGNEQISFIRSLPGDVSDNSFHETTSPCPSSTSGGESSDEEICVSLLSTTAEGRSGQAQAVVPSPSAGRPDAPLDVQVQLGSSPEILVISWLPITIDAAGSSNGVRVTGYTIYISGRKVMEIMSPTAGSVPLEVSKISVFVGPLKVSVRTLSALGESEDSVPALIPSVVRKALGTLLSRFVASGWTFQEFLESECCPVPAPPCRFSPHISCM